MSDDTLGKKSTEHPAISALVEKTAELRKPAQTDYDKPKLADTLKIDVEDWKKEVMAQDELFIKLHSDLPMELHFQRELLISRL